ncbi:MAG: GNAT family N-acetyltransferase [Acidimicrobiia bacterium]|nr:GNAT family N-acetyltransferase [Acidimicrobiia bacterium]
MNPGDLADLCASALPTEGLTPDDLAAGCFGPDTEVLGDRDGAIAWLRRDFDGVGIAWILLAAVPPERRRHGVGRTLVDEVVTRCRAAGVREVHTGNCAPRYVWPGVDLSQTPALAFFQDLGFEAYDHGLNMVLPTTYRAAPPAGITIEREATDGAVDLARRVFPNWEDEVARGVECGTTFAARDPAGATIAFGAHSVNRHTWIGPMATDPSRRHAGTGRAILAALAADIEATFGVPMAEIAWVAPVSFYAKAGAVAHRAFRMHRLRLDPA